MSKPKDKEHQEQLYWTISSRAIQTFFFFTFVTLTTENKKTDVSVSLLKNSFMLQIQDKENTVAIFGYIAVLEGEKIGGKRSVLSETNLIAKMV